MPATLERTVTVDRSLARRAERKLHRYGTSFDDVVSAALTLVVSTRGMPDLFSSVPSMITVATQGQHTMPRHTQVKRMRCPGGLPGEFWMSDDFDDTPSEVIDDFESAIV